MKKRIFDTTSTGETVHCYTLLGKDNAYVTFLDYGATVHSICVPDKNGVLRDVALGYDTIHPYEIQDSYIGATVGRVCNRIGKATFTLNGVTYPLFANDGQNHLHGGKKGFDKKIWQAEEVEKGIRFTYTSPDGEEGYPGTLQVSVTYIFENNTLSITHDATTDKETLCALTNHCYFNLGGFDSGDILQQIVTIDSDAYTKTDAESIPHGEIVSVNNTPMDFRTPTPIGKGIDSDYEQVRFGKGYDCNWILNDVPVVATAYDTNTGIHMAMTTTLPGLQFYTGNFLDGFAIGKKGVPLGHRTGFCFESQYFPNAMACDGFQKPILKQDETYHHVTTYQFSIR